MSVDGSESSETAWQLPTGTEAPPERTLSGRSGTVSFGGSSVSGVAANARRRASDVISGGAQIANRLGSLTMGVMGRSASVVSAIQGRRASTVEDRVQSQKTLEQESAELLRSVNAAKKMSKDELRDLIA